MQPESDPQVIDLREFFGVIRRRFWSIFLVAFIVTALAVLMVARRTPLYTATARVEVRPLVSDLQAFYYDAFVNMDTEVQRVTTNPIAVLAAPELGVDPASQNDVDALLNDVSASIPANTTYLDISCTSPSKTFAKACADAFANAYKDDRIGSATADYQGTRNGLQAQFDDLQKQINQERLNGTPQSQIDALVSAQAAIRVQQATLQAPSTSSARIALTADLPAFPSNKDYVSTGILAAILGIALGVGLAFVRERLDVRVTGRESLENALDAAVLAVVPEIAGWRNKKDTRVVTVSAPDSPPSEAYKTARTNLLYQASQGGLQVIGITGPGQSEGKTTTTVNLAVTLAQAGKTVVAVSCDLRKPRLHRFFKVDNRTGVSSILLGQATVEEALLATDVPGLAIITSGPVPPNTAELLGSPAMETMLDELRRRFDFVLLDTAPALVVADALSLAPFTDGVIVIADASKTASAAVSHLRHQLERVGTRIVGGVLNNLDPKSAKHYPAYYRAYYSSNYRYAESPPNGNSGGGGRRGRRRGASTPVVPGPVREPEPPQDGPEMWR